jgi:hypothetical protein
MSKVAIYVDDGGNYSAATALGIVCQNVSRDECADILLTTFDVDAREVEAWLENPVSAAEYRAAWSQAVGNSLAATSVAAGQRQQIITLLETAVIAMGAILEHLDNHANDNLRAQLWKDVLRQIDKDKAAQAKRGQFATDEQVWNFLLGDGHESAVALRELVRDAA